MSVAWRQCKGLDVLWTFTLLCLGRSPTLRRSTAAAGLLGSILPVNVGGVQWGIRHVDSFPFVTGVAKKILATLVSPLWAAILAALAFLTLRSALLRKQHSLHLALQVGLGGFWEGGWCSFLWGLLGSGPQQGGAQPDPHPISLQPSHLLFIQI